MNAKRRAVHPVVSLDRYLFQLATLDGLVNRRAFAIVADRMLARLVAHRTAEAIALTNRITVESLNPDGEILTALRPAMATIPHVRPAGRAVRRYDTDSGLRVAAVRFAAQRRLVAQQPVGGAPDQAGRTLLLARTHRGGAGRWTWFFAADAGVGRCVGLELVSVMQGRP